MPTIFVKTQAELDALPPKFDEFTYIYIQNNSHDGRIAVVMNRENSSVEARGNSSVEARGNSSVKAWGNSSVVARENSSVVARDNSSVEAWENSSVVARDNSSVEAWENSSVVARGNSSVKAWGNSSVVAWGNVGVHLTSTSANVTLMMFSVCWALAKGKIIKKSKNATVIKPKTSVGTNGWLEGQGVKKDKTSVVLFKRVSSEWKTQEGSANETVWAPGSTLELSVAAWSPTNSECGTGKFHACSRPYFCDDFRSNAGDKYVAIRVQVKDLHAWKDPQYPHKIAFRKGTVLYQCDKLGKKIGD